MSENHVKTDPTSAEAPYPNQGEMLRGYVTVAAPLLSGFGLAAVVTLVSADNAPPLEDPALAFLTLSIAAALLSVVFGFYASGYWWPPAEMAAWRPELTVDADELDRARRQQRVYLKVFSSLWRRAVVLFQISLIAALAGLAFALVPDELAAGRLHQLSLWRAAALVIAAGFVTGTLLVILLLPSARASRRLLPTGRPGKWTPGPLAGPKSAVFAAFAPTEIAATRLIDRSSRIDLHAVWPTSNSPFRDGGLAVVARTKSGVWKLGGAVIIFSSLLPSVTSAARATL